MWVVGSLFAGAFAILMWTQRAGTTGSQYLDQAIYGIRFIAQLGNAVVTLRDMANHFEAVREHNAARKKPRPTSAPTSPWSSPTVPTPPAPPTPSTPAPPTPPTPTLAPPHKPAETLEDLKDPWYTQEPEETDDDRYYRSLHLCMPRDANLAHLYAPWGRVDETTGILYVSQMNLDLMIRIADHRDKEVFKLVNSGKLTANEAAYITGADVNTDDAARCINSELAKTDLPPVFSFRYED